MSIDQQSSTSERRRAELLAAAARLMERNGSQAVSMQAVAGEAGVSVGLIYRYFGGKDDLLLAVIIDVLDAFADRVPQAIDEAGTDPVRRVVAAFTAYCEVIDAHRHAAVLTYRETKSLDGPSRLKLKDLEVATSEPLRAVLAEAVTQGLFRPVDMELVSYNLLLTAHGWALKHWFYERTRALDSYVRQQTSLLLHALLRDEHIGEYADLLGEDASDLEG